MPDDAGILEGLPTRNPLRYGGAILEVDISTRLRPDLAQQFNNSTTLLAAFDGAAGATNHTSTFQQCFK